MCTVLNLNKGKVNLFGRNMDIEAPFGQQVVVVPRKYEWEFRFTKSSKTSGVAMIGMAYPLPKAGVNQKTLPLFAEAANEFGLACSSLNFPQNAHWFPQGEVKATKGELVEITPWEAIQWVLLNFKTVKEVKDFITKNSLVIVNVPVVPGLDTAPLHFIISDKTESIVLEQTKDGLKMFDNPLGILTNNPTFDWQLTNLKMYQNISNEQTWDIKWGNYDMKPFGQGFAQVGLPGDTTPPSRFIRTAFYKVNSELNENLEEMVTQMFHILDGVSMVKGAIKVRDPKGNVHDDITLYSACIDTENGVYYYKTYYNNQIQAISMKNENLESDDVVVYPFSMAQSFNEVNKK